MGRAEIGRQYELYNGRKLSSNMDFTECERGINRCTQEILDCDKKIEDLPKRINNMLTVGKQRRNQSKEFEQEAERLRSEADSFCLRGMLNEAEKSARNAIKRDSYAEAYEKSAIVSETNAKELEKITNEFRRIKGELQSEKERLEKSLPKLE